METTKKFTVFLKKLMEGKNKKKVIENSLMILIIGIIAIIAGSTLFGNNNLKSNSNTVTNTNNNTNANSSTEVMAKSVDVQNNSDMEKNMEKILSQIAGAGKVTVLVTYISGKEIVPAVDSKKSESSTKEKDSSGGTRDITQNDYESSVVYEDGQNGAKKPIVVKELQPEVKGVVVVADGAEDPVVKEILSKAVQVLLDIAIYRIQVFDRSK